MSDRKQLDGGTERLAQALGWASIGLGIPQLLGPRAVGRFAGVGSGLKQLTVIRAVGGRELVHAAGLLNRRTRPTWVWTRVAGDAVDLASLGRALRHHDGNGRRRTIAATAAVVGITAIDSYVAVRSIRGNRKGQRMHLTASTTVRKSADEVYEFWRQLDRLPSFMAHVEDVRVDSSTRSHWTITAPLGRTVEWDAEIVGDAPGQRLSWRSVEGADVTNEGTVTFNAAPGEKGTEVHVTLSYDLPGGKVGEVIARVAGEDPHQQLDDDLRRFKQVMETGEVVRSEGAPWGKRAREEFPQHPAQPLDEQEIIDLTQHEGVPA